MSISDGDNVLLLNSKGYKFNLEGSDYSTKYTEIKDNRNMKDSSENQELTGTDIAKLRDQDDIMAEDIVKQIVDGSNTFEQKTKFSQEKYLRRKKDRHLNLFTIEKPTVRLIFDIYLKHKPGKYLSLRFNTMCRMLAYANVQAGSRVLLCETCNGLLTASVLDRMGLNNSGSVVQFYHGSFPSISQIDIILSPMHTKQLKFVRFTDVVPILLHQTLENRSNCTDEDNHDPPIKICKRDEDVDDNHELEQTDDNQTPNTTRKSERINRIASLAHDLDLNFSSPDCLIVATRFYPNDLVLILLQFLPIGKPFVIYFQFLQPLVDLYNALKQRGGVAQLHLTDSWFRFIQVLPERTHPEVLITSNGGYVLSGYTVEPGLTFKELLLSGLLKSSLDTDFV